MVVQFLSTAAVSGVAIVAVVGGFVLYTCGLLTGLLIAWCKRKPRKSSTMAGDASASGDPGVSSQIDVRGSSPTQANC